MLTVKNLNKNFGKVQAVKDVSFHVQEGSMFAFLGTNGAGKSTVIHMLLQLITPTSGFIRFSTDDVPGVVFQSHRLDDALTIEENLLARAKLHGLSTSAAKARVEDLLKKTNLLGQRKRKYGTCSGGEKRKTDIMRALIHEPKLLILDEPTTGLDVESRVEIWEMLRDLQAEQGLTIFLTTHYIEEAADADHVVIMHEGKVEVEGTPAALKEQYAETVLTLYSLELEGLTKKLRESDIRFELEKDSCVISLQTSVDAIEILQLVEGYISRFTLKEASLEEVFIQMTKQMKWQVMKE
ncbi:MAG TPA: ABC transporter ATP-binding protein [Pseudogracilibacillus sp.]|nr:ABC transporter ATP-binding protein [Pseudogracilibacillus sp.]